jgi:hypothetical protein
LRLQVALHIHSIVIHAETLNFNTFKCERRLRNRGFTLLINLGHVHVVVGWILRWLLLLLWIELGELTVGDDRWVE